MEPYFNKMTPAGYAKIQQAIAALKTTRPSLIQALQAARALGDLSENAEYSAAKRDLRHLESRLRFLDKQLRYAEVVTPSDNDQVDIGKYLTVLFLDESATTVYQLVGNPEADLEHGKITLASPIGSALLGHLPGDTVTVSAPNGHYQVQLLKVSLQPPADFDA